jgi:nucleotide-binding universal stress UspA family protein
MAIVDILIYLDTSPACVDRMVLASILARRFDACLTGVGLEEAIGVAERFKNMLRQDGVSGDWRLISGSATAFVVRLSAAADLVILGQHDREVSTGLDAPWEVLTASGRPVLITPNGRSINTLGQRVLIAWDGGRQAVRALHDALPLMAQSEEVILVQINPEDEAAKELAGDVASHLVRHGLNARAESITAQISATAEKLLTRAADVAADLVVMGAYGHSPLRERLLGGVTHDVLRDTSLPVLMSH